MIEHEPVGGTEIANRGPLPFARVDTPSDRNPALVYLARLAPTGRAAMWHALTRIAGEVSGWEMAGAGRCPTIPVEAFPWASLRYQHTAAIRARLLSSLEADSGHRYAPATVNQTISALRGVLREAWRLGQMTAEEHARAVDLGMVKMRTLPKGRALTSGEFVALLATCRRDPKPHGKRDAALFAVLYVGGLRRAEAAALDLADWSGATNELRVRGGKGRADRLVFVENGAAEALLDWLAVRGVGPGPLLLALTKGGKMTARRLTTQTVQDICARRAEQAHVKQFTPHDLRRSCASDLLDSGEDIATVQRHLGHASPTTTARYDRRGDAALKRAATRLHFPY